MGDQIERGLRALTSELPKARLGLSEPAKDALVAAVGGPRTAQNLLRAKSEFPIERIPFLFNSLDASHVVDILHNDMEAAIERAFAAKAARPKP